MLFFITLFIKVEGHFCIALSPIVCSKPYDILVRHLHPTCNVSVAHHLSLIVQVKLSYNAFSLLN